MSIDQETVNKAIALIEKGSVNADYFFEQIKSPDWVQPLAAAGFFEEPYPVNRRGDVVSFPLWTPGQYLARMATIPGAQQRVVEILESLPASDNPRVYEAVADAAAALPPEMASRLIPQLVRGLELPFQLFVPDKVADVVAKVASAGLGTDAIKLSSALLEVVPSPPKSRDGEEDNLRGLRKVHGRVDDWQYGRLLARLVGPLMSAAGMQGVRMFCDLLERAVIEERHEPVKGQQDYSYIWRPTIEHARGHHYSITDDLVTAVRDASGQLVAASPDAISDVVDHLLGRSMHIFCRIALHIIGQNLQYAQAELPKVLGTPSDWEDVGLRPEFEYLLAHSFPMLPGDIQRAYLQWIDNGPDLNQYIDRRKAFQGTPPDHEDVTRHQNRWTLDHLGLLADHLPPEHKQHLARLVESLGPPREPRPAYSMSEARWISDKSPLSEDEALSLDWPTIAGMLKSWVPTDHDIDGPSEDGLAGSVRQRVKANPREAIANLHEVGGLDPRYYSAILESLREVLKEEEGIEWEPLLVFLARLTREAHERSQNDKRWPWVSQCAASLLDDSFGAKTPIPVSLRQDVWQILQILAEHPDPNPDYESQSDASQLDPATMSINTVRGETMHAVMRYALWWRRHLESLQDAAERTTAGFEELPEVRELLEHHLDVERDASVAVRAVYGQWFPWLVLLDSAWALSNVRDIFPDNSDDPLLWAAWGSYIVFCPAYTNVLPMLRPVYIQAIHAVTPAHFPEIGVGEQPTEHLAVHIMSYYWRGEISLEDELVTRFFETAGPKLRAHALTSLGRALYNLDEVPDEGIATRLRSLWDWRAGQEPIDPTELAAFGWWFGSRMSDEAWTLEKLEHLLQQKVLPEPDHLVVRRLSGIVKRRPVEAVRCLARMVDLAADGWSIHGWLSDARAILEVALQSHDDAAQERAEELIHKFGTLRFRDFRALLKDIAGSK